MRAAKAEPNTEPIELGGLRERVGWLDDEVEYPKL